MSDSRSNDVGRVSFGRHRDDTERTDAAEKAVRPPPRRQPKRKFQMDDERKNAPLPEKKTADGQKKKGPSLFELSSRNGRHSGELLSGSKTTRHKGELGDEGKGLTTDDEAAEQSALAQLGAVKKDGGKNADLNTTGDDGAAVERDDGEEGVFQKDEKKNEKKGAKEGALTAQGDKDPKIALQESKLEEVGTISGGEKPVAVPKTDLQDLVKQIAKHLTQMKAADQTDTTVTIKHPPLFEGAKLTMTEFDSAKGEFNIKFTNLSEQARLLVDQMQNQDALRQALENKGFTLHIITSTHEDQPIATAESQESREGQREGEQEQDQQQQEREEEDDSWLGPFRNF